MVYVSVKHQVADYDTWKVAFDDHAAKRKEGGEISAVVLRKSGEPNMVSVMFKWESAEKAESFLGSDDLKEAMKQAGVISQPDIEIYDLV